MKNIFNNIIQVGMVTNDLVKSMENYYKKYKIGPFYVLEFNAENVQYMTVNGNKRNYSMKIGVSEIGTTRFELIQPLDYSNYNEFYNKYGSDIIHHLKLSTENYYEVLNYLNNLGIKSLQSGNQSGIKGENIYNYLSTSRHLGFIAEIFDVSKDFIKPDPDYWFPDQLTIGNKMFNKLSAIGMISEKLLEKIEIYQDLYGIGPWEIINFSNDNIKEMHIYEEKYDYKMEIAFCQLGDIQLKLIKPKSYSIYTEFLQKYGEEVIHHLRLAVENFSYTIDYFKSIGIKVIQRGKYMGIIDFAYLDTASDLNFIIELVDNKNIKDCNTLNLP